MARVYKKCLGIDISDTSVEIVEVQRKRGKVTITASQRIVLPEGVVTHGVLQDPEQFAALLSQGLEHAQPKPISTKHAVVALPDSQAYTHVVQMAALRKKDIEQALPHTLAKVIPLPEQDMSYAYRLEEKKKDHIDVSVVATSEQVLLTWAKFFVSMDLTVSVFDIAPLASYRALFPKPTETPTCIIDIGERTTRISFFDKTGMRYTQSGHVAGAAMTQAVADSVKDPKKAIETHGLDQKEKKVASAVAGVVDTLIEDIQTAVTFYEKTRSQEIETILLVGGASQTKGLVSYVQEKLKDIAPVSLGASGAVASVGIAYLGAYGMAIRGVQSFWAKRDIGMESDYRKVREKKKQTKKESKTTRAPEDDIPQEPVHVDVGTTQTQSQEAPNSTKQLFVLLLVTIIGGLALLWALDYRATQRAERLEEQFAAQQQLPPFVAPNVEPQIVADDVTTTAVVGTSTISVGEDSSTSTPSSTVSSTPVDEPAP